jgi:uncharacterized protein
MLTRSRYLLIGNQQYLTPAGKKVKLGYSTRMARFFTMDPAVAASLASGDVAALAESELSRLAGLKAVVDDAEDELDSILHDYRVGSDDPGARVFTIMPTSYCNMACDYCGQEHFKSPVNQTRVDKVAARVLAAIADPATTRVGVTWFGGEPLLALRVVRELSAKFVAAAHAAGKPYSARMATNGSLLTKATLTMLHRDCKLNSVAITVDGPEELHDRRRIKRNGIGSFHRTIAVLGDVVKERSLPGLQIIIRINVDNENEHAVSDLICDLACFGLASPQVDFQPMPVHSWGNDVSAVELEGRRYAKTEAQWLRLAQSLGIGFGNLPGATKVRTCAATSPSVEILNSSAEVYSCSEHPLVPVVRETGILTTLDELADTARRPLGQFDDWYDQVGDGEQQCGRCPLLPVCGGSCPKLWREGHVPCPSIKYNWSERLDLAAVRLGYQRVEEASDRLITTR